MSRCDSGVSPGWKRDVLAGLYILAFSVAYFAAFRRMILTEDTGFYGFLARSILDGAVLHRDIPVATNSIGIYLTAVMFHFVGARIVALRLFHLAGLALLLVGVYLTLSRRIAWGSALAATAVASIFVADPSVMLDLGRNFVFWATAMVVLGLYLDQATDRRPLAVFGSGVAFGLGALFRETFVVFPLVYLAYLCVEAVRAVLRGEGWRISLRRPALFVLGVASALSIDAALLTANGTWHAYFRAMVSSGGSARYTGGILSPKRLVHNLARWLPIPRHNVALDIPLFLAALPIYLQLSGSRVVRAVKYVMIPAALVEALVVNRTFSYHVAPLVVFVSMLVGFSLHSDHVPRWIGMHAGATYSRWRQRVLSAVLAFGVAVVGVLSYAPMAARSIDGSLGGSPSALLSSRVNTDVLSGIADAIPHDRITTDAQWQLLLLSRQAYPARPFIEDATAAFNLNRPDIWRQTMNMIRNGEVDLLASKTSIGTYPQPGVSFQGTDYGQLIAEKYCCLADLGIGARTDYFSPVKYRDRLMIRRALVAEYPVVAQQQLELGPAARSGVMEVPGAGSYVVTVRPAVDMSDGDYSLSVDRSRVVYQRAYTSENIISSFVPANGHFRVAISGSVRRPIRFTVQVRQVP